MKKLLIVISAATLLCGCTSKYTGSRTVVGDHMALPELSDSADTVSLRVYESVKGAKVWTAKDCNVNINYTNAYTNTYFGIVESRDSMTLSVRIEPCETAGAERSGEGSSGTGEGEGPSGTGEGEGPR